MNGYKAVLVRFTTKAVHFELCTNLTTKVFLAAFTRFIGRIGFLPKKYQLFKALIGKLWMCKECRVRELLFDCDECSSASFVHGTGLLSFFF